MDKPRLILASGSPRRRELLERYGVPFEILPAVGEERVDTSLTPSALVTALAAAKAEEVARVVSDPSAVVLAADTVVELDGTILGKPHSEEDAYTMLSGLSGNEHFVHTGVCVLQGSRQVTACETAAVRFRRLEPSEISAYIASGEPMDKAGAYGYQGLAAAFVEGISGDFYTVMGLPICRLSGILKDFGIPLFQEEKP